ncbi:cyclin-domain-containing protein [Hyaloraphidium curvatum]|nr:cyclin-domain-containing protein [Hyaloraphidium curvatum]
MASPTFDLGTCAPADTIRLVAAHVERLTAANDGVGRGDLTRFHARTVPTIDVLAYLGRILKYAPCGNEVFLAVLVYFDRISRRANALLDAADAPSPAPPQAAPPPPSPGAITQGLHAFQPFGPRQPAEGVEPPALGPLAIGRPGSDDDGVEFTMSKKRKKKVLIINSYNVHRLVITGVMVASKLFSDVFFLNSHYAKVGGLPVMELNQLELEFLIFNDFNLHVTIEELQRMGDALLRHASEVFARGVPDRGLVLRDTAAQADYAGMRFDNRKRPPDTDGGDGANGFGGGGFSSSGPSGAYQGAAAQSSGGGGHPQSGAPPADTRQAASNYGAPAQQGTPSFHGAAPYQASPSADYLRAAGAPQRTPPPPQPYPLAPPPIAQQQRSPGRSPGQPMYPPSAAFSDSARMAAAQPDYLGAYAAAPQRPPDPMQEGWGMQRTPYAEYQQPVGYVPAAVGNAL